MKKIIAGAALLSALSFPALAADYTTIHLNVAVNRPAEAVWAKVGDYCAITDWLKVKCMLTSGTGEVGTIRQLNGTTEEILVAKTPLSYAYTQPASTILYHGTLEVRPVDAGHSQIFYTLMYDQAPLATPEAQDANRQSRTRHALPGRHRSHEGDGRSASRSADQVRIFRMALHPGHGISAARYQPKIVGAGMIGDRLHQPARRAGAAQGEIGFDMGQHIAIVVLAVIGKDQKPLFGQFEAMLFDVVDHAEHFQEKCSCGFPSGNATTLNPRLPVHPGQRQADRHHPQGSGQGIEKQRDIPGGMRQDAPPPAPVAMNRA